MLIETFVINTKFKENLLGGGVGGGVVNIRNMKNSLSNALSRSFVEFNQSISLSLSSSRRSRGRNNQHSHHNRISLGICDDVVQRKTIGAIWGGGANLMTVENRFSKRAHYRFERY